jgi:hypothetical protein
MRALERTELRPEDERRQDFGGEMRVEAMPCRRVSKCPPRDGTTIVVLDTFPNRMFEELPI